MKTILLTVLMAILSLSIHAQQANVGSADAGTQAGGKVYRNDISTRAMRDFAQRYKTVDSPEWVEIKGGYSARFTLDSIRTRVDYSMGGNWTATMRYYKEKHLPKPVRSQVKSRYYDYDIDMVIEITWEDDIMYEIHLSDSNSLKNIRVYNDEIKIISEYRKTTVKP